MESCGDLYEGRATVIVLELRWRVSHGAFCLAVMVRFPQKGRVSSLTCETGCSIGSFLLSKQYASLKTLITGTNVPPCLSRDGLFLPVYTRSKQLLYLIEITLFKDDLIIFYIVC